MDHPIPETGEYVDDRWGQYSAGRIVVTAVDFGMKLDKEADALLDAELARGPYPADTEPEDENHMEFICELADEAEAWLNEHRTDSYHYWGSAEGGGFGYWLMGSGAFDDDFGADLQRDITNAETKLEDARSRRRIWIGLARNEGMSDSDIGEILGVSRQRVAQIIGDGPGARSARDD